MKGILSFDKWLLEGFVNNDIGNELLFILFCDITLLVLNDLTKKINQLVLDNYSVVNLD